MIHIQIWNSLPLHPSHAVSASVHLQLTALIPSQSAHVSALQVSMKVCVWVCVSVCVCRGGATCSHVNPCDWDWEWREGKPTACLIWQWRWAVVCILCGLSSLFAVVLICIYLCPSPPWEPKHIASHVFQKSLRLQFHHCSEHSNKVRGLEYEKLAQFPA